MKKTGLIITILIAVIMVGAITFKLANQKEPTSSLATEYKENGQAGKLTPGMIGITPANYDEKVTNSKGVVIVDYFAPTCSYCIKYTPIFSSVFAEYMNKATFGKFDVTTDRSKISSLKITGTPTTIFFKDGKEISRLEGFVSEAALKAEVDKTLAQ